MLFETKYPTHDISASIRAGACVRTPIRERAWNFGSIFYWGLKPRLRAFKIGFPRIEFPKRPLFHPLPLTDSPRLSKKPLIYLLIWSCRKSDN